MGQSLAGVGLAPPGLTGVQASYGCLWRKNPAGAYEAQPLHLLTAGSGWIFDNGVCVGGSNIIGATGFIQPIVGQAPSSTHGAVLLMPAELVVDANGDAKIDASDRGLVSVRSPFRWWINDDDRFGRP